MPFFLNSLDYGSQFQIIQCRSGSVFNKFRMFSINTFATESTFHSIPLCIACPAGICNAFVSLRRHENCLNLSDVRDFFQ